MKAEIRYLSNSGFLVETASHILVFDYYLDTPCSGRPEDGVLGPAALAGKPAVVFVSHRHSDHFNPVIFSWRDEVPGVRYVLSDDVPARAGADFLAPGEQLDGGGFTVRALRSTDEGAAFLVKIDGLTIYHAGDLNWWHWNGETPEYNERMEADYKGQIDQLKGEQIDLAFVPVDPRLEDKYLWGLDYFMREVGACLAVPMHFGGDFSVFGRIAGDPLSEPYRGQVAQLTRRGQRLALD